MIVTFVKGAGAGPRISLYLTERINRFGEYSIREIGVRPEAYDPEPDVDFPPA